MDASRLVELPLFPLDLVLFPRMLLPLHIFEERYRAMVGRCLETGEPFGIVRVTGSDAITGELALSPIGCLARIVRAERLDDGRLNIEVVGEERFRLHDSHSVALYRTGLIEIFEDEPSTDPDLLASLADDVTERLRRYLEPHLRQFGQSLDDFELPDEPEALSLTAACVLPIELDEKQRLLELSDTMHRLRSARALLATLPEPVPDPEPPEPTPSYRPLGVRTFLRYRCSN
jgi:Lon protease-like protein